jgi:shikimate kinase
MNEIAPAQLRELTPETIRRRLGARSIVLVGMPGSGKSSIARRLAPRLGLPYFDADSEIVKAANGMSISDIFTRHGEAEFRALEARVVARLIEAGPSVIATGGGAFMNADTRALMQKHAISIWLKAEIPMLLRRVKRKGNRPLLAGGEPETALRNLLSEREATYEKADIAIVSHDGPHSAVVDSILQALERRLTAAEAVPDNHGKPLP